MQEIHEPLSIGAVVRGRYIIADVLDRGEFSATYLVRDKRNRRDFYILKELLSSNRRVRQRVPPDVALLKRLYHPSLPRVLDVFNDDIYQRAYVLMEYIEGQPLHELMATQPGQHIPATQIMARLASIVDAVAYLHSQQPSIIHYAIRPSNILVRKTDNQSVLVGFDLAQQYNVHGITRIQPDRQGYDAPEQYHTQGKIGLQTDVYALGATLYTLLAGTVPPDALTRETQVRLGKRDPLVPLSQIVPSLPKAIVMAIHRALAIESNDRFSTVEQFRTALRQEVMMPVTPMPALLQKTSYIQRFQRVANIPRPYLTFFALFLLLITLIGVMTSLLLYGPRHLQSHPMPTVKATKGTVTPHSTPGNVTATPFAKGTPFPLLVSVYHGTIHDISKGETTEMSLTDVQQQQATIRGNFMGLAMKSPFIGTISTSNHIQFILTQNIAQRIVSFDGMIRSDRTISGTFCSSLQPANCDDYGVWSVAT